MALPWPVSVAQRRAETGGCGVGQSNYKGMFQSIQPGLPSKVMQSIPKTSFCFQGINLFMRACLSIFYFQVLFGWQLRLLVAGFLNFLWLIKILDVCVDGRFIRTGQPSWQKSAQQQSVRPDHF